MKTPKDWSDKRCASNILRQSLCAKAARSPAARAIVAKKLIDGAKNRNLAEIKEAFLRGFDPAEPWGIEAMAEANASAFDPGRPAGRAIMLLLASNSHGKALCAPAQPFFESALESGDFELACALSRMRVDPGASGPDSLLARRLRAGDKDGAKLLLCCGALPNISEEKKPAAGRTYSMSVFAMLQNDAFAGLNPESVRSKSLLGLAFDMHCGHADPGFAKAACSLEPLPETIAGKPLAHWIYAQRGHLWMSQIAEILFAAGMDPDAVDKNGHAAEQTGKASTHWLSSFFRQGEDPGSMDILFAQARAEKERSSLGRACSCARRSDAPRI